MHSSTAASLGQIITAKALIELFKQPKPVYILTDYRNWQMLDMVDQFRALHPQLLFRQTGYEEDPTRDLVIFTNSAASHAQSSR